MSVEISNYGVHATFRHIFQLHFCYTFIHFQAALVGNNALVLKGHLEDGIPVPGGFSRSKIVNVSTAAFPLQLDFGISSIDCEEELSSDSCPAQDQDDDELTSAIIALQGWAKNVPQVARIFQAS